MMNGDAAWMGWMGGPAWWTMALAMLAIWGTLVLVVWWLFFQIRRGDAAIDELQRLDQRRAQGDIGEDEWRRLRARLLDRA